MSETPQGYNTPSYVTTPQRGTPSSSFSSISNSSNENDLRPLNLWDRFDNEVTYIQPANIPQDTWGHGEMPEIPEYEEQKIDINTYSFDYHDDESIKIKDYLEKSVDNIAILFNGKAHLTKRSEIRNQDDPDTTVYECLQAFSRKKSNVISNLPLYNIKKIGLNLNSINEVGIVPELVYMDGIDSLLEDNWQLYSIIPLYHKILVTIISHDEAEKLGSDFAGISALHCQPGQGALAGVIVKANPIEGMEIGGKKRKTTKKRKSHKKQKKVNAVKKRTLKNSKKKLNPEQKIKSRTKK